MRFDKKLLKDVVTFDCARQSLLSFAEDDPRWLADPQPILTRALDGDDATALGKQYEQAVYAQLITRPWVVASPNRSGGAAPLTLRPERLHDMLRAAATEGPAFSRCLVEHQWSPRATWLSRCVTGDSAHALAERGALRLLRPDLLMLSSADTLCAQSPDRIVRALRADGQVTTLTEAQARGRVGVQVIEVKRAHAESVGKRHMVELAFYAHALADALEALDLSERFFVCCDGHAVLPRREPLPLIDTPRRLHALCVPVRWDDAAFLFTSALSQLQALWTLRPCALEDADVNIQPACGRCRYFDDCMHRLGADAATLTHAHTHRAPDVQPDAQPAHPHVQLTRADAPPTTTPKRRGRGRAPRADAVDTAARADAPTPNAADAPHTDAATAARGAIDARLLPYTTRALAAQLRAHGLYTIKDVAERLLDTDLGPTPTALHPERPVLALQARAIMQGTQLTAQQAGVGERHFSVNAPRECTARLVLNAETDPTSGVVFGVGLQLRIGSGGPTLRPLERAWWSLWSRWLASTADEHLSPQTLTELRALLDHSAHALHDLRALIAHAARFAAALWSLQRAALTSPSAASLTLTAPDTAPDTGDDPTPTSPCDLEARYIYVSDSLSWDSERTLARNALTSLHAMARLCDALEGLLWAPCDLAAPARVEGHLMAGFYWSREQRDHLQEMLDRHLPSLLCDDALQPHLAEALRLLAPARSAVQPPKQHQKLFNLRDYVETSWGLPHFINCTWHGLARHLDPALFSGGLGADTSFWAPHFNAMSHGPWHRLISEPDFDRKHALRARVVRELQLKLRCIHRIVDATTLAPALRSALIWSASEAPPAAALRDARAHPGWHALARAWSLFAQLSAALQRAERDAARLTYPTYSIGKLVAAEVSALRVVRDRFCFQLQDLSASMKVAVGDRVLLVRDRDRDLPHDALKRYVVEVVSMAWHNPTRSQQLTAASYRRQHPYLSQATADESHALRFEDPCYLYQTSLDVWTDRLHLALRRRALATSWLGHRLAFCWDIDPSPTLPQPAQPLTVDLAALYLFSPQSLPPHPAPDIGALTSASPPPDPSQARCIARALSQTLSCLQGPPGTGKSQTIAALIDAFITRRGPSARVLVTAASYAALQVVLDKVMCQHDAEGCPTPAAEARALFARSSSRAAVGGQPGYERVEDLVASAYSLKLNQRKVGSRWLLPAAKGAPSGFILFANPHQLIALNAHLDDGNTNDADRADSTDSADAFLDVGEAAPQRRWLPADFGFDLIIIDEASQMPTDQLLAPLALIHRGVTAVRILNADGLPPDWPARSPDDVAQVIPDAPLRPARLTQVVIVGDHHQLPPVQPVKPPEKLQVFLGSLFRFYVEGHGLTPSQLEVNYRSHPDIVACTRHLNLYPRLDAFRADHPLPPLPPLPDALEPWLRAVLDPSHAVSGLIHDTPFEAAVSPLEATLAAQVAVGFFLQLAPQDPDEERRFWRESLGVVTPHNAQGRLITRLLFDALTARGCSTLPSDELMRRLQETIFSVEKFQGSDRALMIASMGVSAHEQLSAEESFIYDLNRFNVLTSRARYKMIVICSRAFLCYIPNDRDVMCAASHARHLLTAFCNQSQTLFTPQPVEHRWHADPDAPAHAAHVVPAAPISVSADPAPPALSASPEPTAPAVEQPSAPAPDAPKRRGRRAASVKVEGPVPAAAVEVEGPAPAAPVPAAPAPAAPAPAAPVPAAPVPVAPVVPVDVPAPKPVRAPHPLRDLPGVLGSARNAVTRRHTVRQVLQVLIDLQAERASTDAEDLCQRAADALDIVRLDAASRDFLRQCARWLTAEGLI